MNPVGEWGRRIAYLLNRKRRDDELRLEMEAHRSLLKEPARFGSVLRLREEANAVWGWGWLEDLLQDLRYAARTLVAQRAFSLAAVTTLAAGIGATTAIFSVVSALVLRPLPFAEPERLVQMHGSSALTPRGDAVNSREVYRRESTSFEALAGYEVGARYLRRGDGAERVMTVRADADFFRMLAVPALRGRTFGPGDDRSAIVVGEAFWRRLLGADEAAIGSTLTLDDEPFTIVGVMPASFQFPYGAASLLPGVASELRTDLWMAPEDRPRAVTRIGSVTGRLKPGVAIAAAEAELKAIARRLEVENPEANRGRTVYLEPLADAVVAPAVRRVLFMLFGASGLVLALACANVANLSLARISVRAREVAVRAALGAGRGRLVRQFLTESLALSLAGGAAGLAIAWWGTPQLMIAAAPHIPRAHEVAVDWRVFVFLLAVCTLTAAILAVAPAAVAADADGTGAQAALRDAAGRSPAGARHRRLRDVLIVAEVALAFVLAVGAAMLVRELVRLRATDAGLDTARVMTFHLGNRTTPASDGGRFYAIEERVARVPGVEAAGLIQLLPLQNWGWTSNSSDFVVRGRQPIAPVFPIQLRYVTPGYFRAMGVAIERGRGFTMGDTAEAPPVIVINRALARRFFGADDPVGYETSRGTIVGVAADVRQAHLDRPSDPEIYYPAAQNWSQVSELGMTLVVRASGRPEALVQPVSVAVREVSPQQAIFNVRTMERVVADSLSDFTLYLSLMNGFAVLALVLALTGTYGVIACVAAARRKEFAIRIALGADGTRVSKLVLRQAAMLAGIGIGLGVVAALAASPIVKGLPVTVRPPDLSTTAPVAIFIALVALAASLAPALRAARVDPVSALREE